MEYQLVKDHFEIVEFEGVLKDVQAFILEHQHKDMVIQTKDDYKFIKNERTVVRKKLEEVSSLRKSINEISLGIFNSQCKEIEKLLNDCDAEMKNALESTPLEISGATPKAKKFVIKVTCLNEKDAEKVIKKLSTIQNIYVEKGY